jgi:hypothetical protein
MWPLVFYSYEAEFIKKNLLHEIAVALIIHHLDIYTNCIMIYQLCFINKQQSVPFICRFSVYLSELEIKDTTE